MIDLKMSQLIKKIRKEAEEDGERKAVCPTQAASYLVVGTFTPWLRAKTAQTRAGTSTELRYSSINRPSPYLYGVGILMFEQLVLHSKHFI